MLPRPGLVFDFNNILQAAFARADPKSAKMADDFTVIFALLGLYVKAACKVLMKSTLYFYLRQHRDYVQQAATATAVTVISIHGINTHIFDLTLLILK
jgi:hypothetical protein